MVTSQIYPVYIKSVDTICQNTTKWKFSTNNFPLNGPEIQWLILEEKTKMDVCAGNSR